MTASRLDTIRMISFDADETLWDFQKVMGLALQRALEELHRQAVHSPVPAQARALTTDDLKRTRDLVAAACKGQAISMEEIRLRAFQQTVTELSIEVEGLAQRLLDVYLTCRFEEIELYDEVRDALQELAPQFAFGLLTNGNTYPDKCGLAGVFACEMYAQDHGLEKPDGRLYQLFLQKAGLLPHEVLHVGDSLRNDVWGAQQVGMPTVWLNRYGAKNGTGIVPDYELTSLDELVALLKG